MNAKSTVMLVKSITLRLCKWVSGLSLNKKLFISYIIIFVVPIVALGWLFTNNMMKNEKAEAVKRNMQDIAQIRSTVLNNIELCKNASVTAISTKNFLETISENRDFSIEEMMQFSNNTLFNIENILNINTLINKLRVFIKNENINEIYPCLRYESLITNRKWYADIQKMNGMAYWRLNHIDDCDIENSGTGEVVSLFREVKFYNMHMGTEEVNILADAFYGNIYADVSDNSYMIFIIKGKNEQYWNPKSNFLSVYGLNAQDLGNRLLEYAGGEEGNFEIKAEGLDYSVSYTYIRYMDTYIYKILSLRKISNSIKRMQLEAIAIMLLIIVIFSVFTYSITSILLRKMRLIVSYMRRVQEGDLFVEVPVHGNDEIGELSRHFQLMLDKINELIFTVVKKQVAAKNAEISALHSQINAHFIYNVLESIKMMAIVEYKYDISDALTALGRLMRYSMSWKRQYVHMEDEIKQIKNYIKLLNMRFNNGIELCLDIEERLLSHEILKMMIQPIVENSINHGFEPKGTGGKITVRAYTEECEMIIEIKDDGIGMSAAKLEALRKGFDEGSAEDIPAFNRNGIGLGNVDERIKLFYGKEYGLLIDSRENAFTSVVIRLPYLWQKGRVKENDKKSAGG